MNNIKKKILQLIINKINSIIKNITNILILKQIINIIIHNKYYAYSNIKTIKYF